MKLKFSILLIISCLILIPKNARGETTLRNIFSVPTQLNPDHIKPFTNEQIIERLKKQKKFSHNLNQIIFDHIIPNAIKGLKRSQWPFGFGGGYGTGIKQATLQNLITILKALKDEIPKDTKKTINVDPGPTKLGSKSKPQDLTKTFTEWIEFFERYDKANQKKVSISKDGFYTEDALTIEADAEQEIEAKAAEKAAAAAEEEKKKAAAAAEEEKKKAAAAAEEEKKKAAAAAEEEKKKAAAEEEKKKAAAAAVSIKKLSGPKKSHKPTKEGTQIKLLISNLKDILQKLVTKLKFQEIELSEKDKITVYQAICDNKLPEEIATEIKTEFGEKLKELSQNPQIEELLKTASLEIFKENQDFDEDLKMISSTFPILFPDECYKKFISALKLIKISPKIVIKQIIELIEQPIQVGPGSSKIYSLKPVVIKAHHTQIENKKEQIIATSKKLPVDIQSDDLEKIINELNPEDFSKLTTAFTIMNLTSDQINPLIIDAIEKRKAKKDEALNPHKKPSPKAPKIEPHDEKAEALKQNLTLLKQNLEKLTTSLSQLSMKLESLKSTLIK